MNGEIYVDIDGVIATKVKGDDYAAALPIPDTIDKINKLYDMGYRITYWTARGATTGKDWRELTERQLTEWECKYHVLSFRKPYFDKLIDDKAVRPEEL